VVLPVVAGARGAAVALPPIPAVPDDSPGPSGLTAPLPLLTTAFGWFCGGTTFCANAMVEAPASARPGKVARAKCLILRTPEIKSRLLNVKPSAN
jgi:hypothetical protein